MEVKKAEGLVDWLDQRLAIRKLMEVMMTKYWVPKTSISFGRWALCYSRSFRCSWCLDSSF